jgi:hypothetical protein
MQTARGAALLGVAVLVGVVLLNTAPSEGTSSVTTKVRRTTTTLARTLPLPLPTNPGGPTTSAAPRAPSQVSVLVANGTTITGAASRVNTQLIQAGYTSVGTANGNRQDTTTTLVDYVPGFQADAAALAVALSLPASAAQAMPAPPPVTNTKGADLVVVVGTDVASQITPPGGPAPSDTAPAQTPAPTSKPTTTLGHTTSTVRRSTTSATG